MITIRPGSRVYRIVTLLAIVGEFPIRSIRILGNVRTYRRVIITLANEQSFRNPKTGEVITTKLINISGKANGKTIRLYVGALPILGWLGLLDYYNTFFDNHRFSGDEQHKDRNHRVAEVYAMFMRAGILFPPYIVPILQDGARKRLFQNNVAFYSSRILKNVSTGEINKTKFIRIVGALFAYEDCYAIYNTRNAILKWHGGGEIKIRTALTELARLNSADKEVDSSILFGKSEEKGLQTVLASQERRGKDFRLDMIYHSVHFLPLDENGIRMLRFFRIRDWKEKLLSILFEDSELTKHDTPIECDAYVNGRFVLSYLDGDMAKLIRFYNATKMGKERCGIVCYPFQEQFIKNHFGKEAVVKTIDIHLVEKAMLEEE